MGRLLLAALIMPLALSLGGGASRAQQPGDVYWQMVPNGFLADSRIQQALLFVIDTDAAAAEIDGALIYGSELGIALLDEAKDRREEAPILFAAAGFDNPSEQFVETRRCRVWIPDDAEAPETLADVATTLGEALSGAWAEFGVEIQPCEITSSRDQADVLVWGYGQDYAIVEGAYDFQAESYVGTEVERPGAIPGGTGGGAPDVSPPATGDGGLR
jgi:hypothetical protein